MYFVMIRPQAKKAKDHATTLAQLKPGDEIVTTGGIIARVKSIHPTFILIDTGHHSMKLLKEHVARLSKDLTGVTAPGK
jgi:preprotein translocase subunit YajC